MRVTEKPRGLLRKSKLGFQRIDQEEDIIYSAGQDNRLYSCSKTYANPNTIIWDNSVPQTSTVI